MIPKPTTDEAESRLLDLIDEYWGIAYTEGKEGRTRDNETSDAGRKWAEIRAALASLKAPAAEGWVLVPVEATREMCVAAVKFANGDAVYKNVAAGALEIEEGIYGEVYEAMLAAAHPPKEKT
jgi:hypothetical protein